MVYAYVTVFLTVAWPACVVDYSSFEMHNMDHETGSDRSVQRDQLVLVNLAPHARKLHPLHTRHAEIAFCTW